MILTLEMTVSALLLVLVAVLALAGGLLVARFFENSEPMRNVVPVLLLAEVLFPVCFWELADLFSFTPGLAGLLTAIGWGSAFFFLPFVIGWLDPLGWVRR